MSRLATPTLIVAANAPDIDVLAFLWGPWAALAWRRGLTHGLPALLLLPLLTVGFVLLVDRLLARHRRVERPPPRAAALLALATLGTATHPLLDWVNTYGMRWLLPFDGAWSYGDALFILDPWLWLLLGGPVFLTWSRTRGALVAWGILAALLSVVVLGTGVAPLWARCLWVAGLVGWISLRQWSSAVGERGRRPARWALLAASGYALLMVGVTPVASAIATHEAREELGVTDIDATMVGPVPADPLGGQVIIQTREEYRTGTFRWTRRPRVEWAAEPIPRGAETDVVEAARRHPEVDRFLVWSRFPLHRVTPHPDGWWVRFEDARYLGSGGGALGGVQVFVHPDLSTGREPSTAGEY